MDKSAIQSSGARLQIQFWESNEGNLAQKKHHSRRVWKKKRIEK
jgi:hypothetical protein